MVNLFVIIVRYIVEPSEIAPHLDDHINFLDEHYKNGTFITSGPQTPKTGGLIIAKCDNRLTLANILNNDPFVTRNLGEYQIFEFTPVFYAPAFKKTLEELAIIP